MSEEDPLVFEDNAIAQIVYGENDRNLRALEELVEVQIQARGNRVRFRGESLECKVARRTLQDLYDMAGAGVPIEEGDVRHVARRAEEGSSPASQAIFDGHTVDVGRRKRVVPRTENQRIYLETIREYDLTFGLGPAGTGKTYLAVAMAVSALRARDVGRIILTRPAVEAGEKLGFLPGTLFEKVDPYLRPLMDALHDMLDAEEVARRMERGIIEIAPLAYMRGRTLNDAFIILDEAQNTTPEQMRMFLTRMGFDSKAVINGDTSQIDLPRGQTSGLVEAHKVLAKVDEIAFVEFSEKDVVRHPLVAQVIRAYDQYEPTE